MARPRLPTPSSRRGFRRDDEKGWRSALSMQSHARHGMRFIPTGSLTRHAELLILCARIGFNP
jgi:hypothetical protein